MKTATITPGEQIIDIPATVETIVDATPRFGPSKLITLVTDGGEHLLWYRKRPTKLSPGDKIIIDLAHAKSRHDDGLIITHVTLHDSSVLG